MLPETIQTNFRTLTGRDHLKHTPARPHSKLRLGSDRVPVNVPLLEAFTCFNRLPSTSVSATTDLDVIIAGTGTEVITRSAGGGVNLKSQASSPADNDNVIMTPAATGTGMYGLINAASQLRFEAVVSINVITAMFCSVGLNENITDVDPTGTAGEGAMFCFDPTAEFSTQDAADRGFWVLAHKVDGADTFTLTDVKVIAGRDYHLVIELQEDLTAKYYIDNVHVGTSPALTSGDTVAAFLGLELTATPAQTDMDVRYLSLGRNPS